MRSNVYKLFWQKPTFGLIIVDSVDIKFTQMSVSAKKVVRRSQWLFGSKTLTKNELPRNRVDVSSRSRIARVLMSQRL